MSRPFKGILIWISLVVLLACLGVGVPGEMTVVLLLGWGYYLARVLPQVQLNWGGLGTAACCLVGFTAGLHAFLGWFYRRWQLPDGQVSAAGEVGLLDPARRWKPQWTGATVALILLMFSAGMAASGIAHQLGWLLTSTGPLLEGGDGARTAARRALSTHNLKQIGIASADYCDGNRSFPPGCTVDGVGELLHSWMTVILPYNEEQTPYNQIDLTLSWDNPRNAGAFKQVVR